MANLKVDTGHGATITLATTALSFNWTSIDLGESTLEDVLTTHLGSGASNTYQPGDTAEEGEVTIPFQWDPHSAEPVKGTVESVTITFPTVPGGTTGATYAGTGYIKRVKRPNLQTNALQDGELTIKWDGLTPPAFTVGT